MNDTERLVERLNELACDERMNRHEQRYFREAAAALKDARERALEEAARVCRAIQRTMTENGNKATDAAIKDQWEFHAVGAGACAAEIEAIRSLKSISAEQRDKGHLAGGANNRDERSQD